jgi:hypothetical protein
MFWLFEQGQIGSAVAKQGKLGYKFHQPQERLEKLHHAE